MLAAALSAHSPPYPQTPPPTPAPQPRPSSPSLTYRGNKLSTVTLMQAIPASLHLSGIHLLLGAPVQHVPFEGNPAQ